MPRHFWLLAPLAAFSLLLVGCDNHTAPPEDTHQHSAHLHGPNGGVLAKLTDGVWVEFHVVHDDKTLLGWTYTGAHEGELKASEMSQQPVLSFNFGGSEVNIEGKNYPDGGDNVFTFVHAALAEDIPGAKFSMQIGTQTVTVPVPAHHH